MGANFFLVAYLVNNLGAEQYGILILVYSLVTAADFFSHGIGTAVVKYAAHYKAKEEFSKINEVINSAMLFFVVQGIVTSAILFAVIFIFIDSIFNIPAQHIQEIKSLGFILLGYLFTELLSSPFCRLLEGFQRYDFLRLIEITKKILLVLLVFFYGKGLVYIGAAYVISSSVMGASALFLAHGVFKYRIGFSYINKAMCREVINFAWPQFITKITGFLGNKADVFLIGIFLQPFYITVYNIAYQFYMLVTTVINLFGSALLPHVSELHSRNSRDTINRLYLTGTRYSMFVSIPLVISSFFLAEPFLKAWVGDDFVKYGYLVQLYMITGLFMATRVVAVQISVSLDIIRHLVKYYTLGGIINFLVSAILIQYIGITGNVVGTLVGYLFIWYPSNQMLLKKLSIKSGQFISSIIVRPGISILAALPALLLFKILAVPESLYTVLLYECCYAVLYAVSFFYIGFDKIERKEIVGIARQILFKTS